VTTPFKFSFVLEGDTSQIQKASESARKSLSTLNSTLVDLSKASQNVDVARAVLGTRAQGDIGREIAAINNALRTLQASGSASMGELARASRNAQERIKELRREAQGLPEAGNNANLFARGIAAAGVAAAGLITIQKGFDMAAYYIRASDGAKLLDARLKLVSATQGELASNTAAVFEQANRLRSPVEEVGRSFVRIAAGVKELGGSAEEAQKLNEILLTTAKISGSTGAEASAAAIQFAQALGSGVLQGDELRSILENNQELARQLARGLGVSIGELRKLGEEGKLTADVVARALLSRLPEIQQKAGEIPKTTADQLTVLKNELFATVGALDKATGASGLFASSIEGISQAVKGLREGDNVSGSLGLLLGGNIGGFLQLQRQGQLATQREREQQAEFRREANRANVGGAGDAQASSLGIAASAKRELDAFSKYVDDFESPREKLFSGLKKFGDQVGRTLDALQKQRDDLLKKGASTETVDAQIAQVQRQQEAALKDAGQKFAALDKADLERRQTAANRAADIEQAKAALIGQIQQLDISREKATQEQRFNDLRSLYDSGLTDARTFGLEKARLIEEEVAREQRRIDVDRARLTTQLNATTDKKEQLKLQTDLIKLAERELALGARLSEADRVRSKTLSEVNDELDARNELMVDQYDEMSKELEILKQRNNEFGKTRTQIAQARLSELELAEAKLQSKQETEGLSNAERERLGILQNQIKVQREIVAEIGKGEINQAAAEFVGTLGNGLTDVIRTFVTNGKNGFQTLRASFKSIFADFVTSFVAKPLVLNVLANVAGGLGQSGIQNAALQALQGGVGGQGGGLLGNISGLANNALGLGNAASLAGTGFTGGLTGLAGSGLVSLGNALGFQGLANFGLGLQGSAAAALGGAGGTVAAGLGSTLAAALPYIGVALAIASAFAKPRGGAKEGGSANLRFDANGNVLGSAAVPGSDNGRFFTPSSRDSDVNNIVKQLGTDFSATLKALGGTSSGLTIGLGFDTDPKGTAQNRISSQVRDASGRLLFGSQDREVGRDDAQLQAELKIEAKRALLAGLQGSDLPEQIKKALNTVSAQTASEADVDKVLKLAGNVKGLINVLKEAGPQFEKFTDQILNLAQAPEEVQSAVQSLLGFAVLDPFKQAQAELNRGSLFEQFTQGRTQLRELLVDFDGSAEAAQRLSGALQNQSQIQVQLAGQILQLTEQLTGAGGLFADTIREFQLSVLDSEGKFNFLKDESDAAAQALLNATDPEEINRIAQLLNSNIQAQFSLLDPEEQKRRVKEFTDYTKAINDLVKERLEAARTALENERNADLPTSIQAAIELALTKIAAQNQTAADTQLAAANTNLAAANTPQQIVVTLTGNGGYEVGPQTP
jgi:tape measure domain-containing protein